jgi:hypothetical protein
MDSPKTPDSLSRTLAGWQVDAPRNPQFRTAVWARIGRGGGALPWMIYLRQHAAPFAGALALAVVLGALGGRERARARVAAESAKLAAAYVQGLDARSMEMR